jgi:hypothetical protein
MIVKSARSPESFQGLRFASQFFSPSSVNNWSVVSAPMSIVPAAPRVGILHIGKAVADSLDLLNTGPPQRRK